MAIDIDGRTKISVRGDGFTEAIPTDVVYKGIIWGLIGAIWDSEKAEFIGTYERTDTEPADPTDTVQEIEETLYFK